MTLKKDPGEYLASFRKFELPYGSGWMWMTFMSLSAARPSSDSGPSGIPLTEIEAWGRLYCHQFNRMELECIQILDSVWLEEVRKHGRNSSS